MSEQIFNEEVIQSTPKEETGESSKINKKTQSSIKKTSGTFNVLKSQQKHIGDKKDENLEVESEIEDHYTKPLSDRTARTAEEITKGYLDRHFKDWKNESNLTVETLLTIFTYEKDTGVNLTTQRVLGDVLEKALRGKYNKLGFKNVERAKSVIAFIYSLTEVNSLKEITPTMKNKAIQAILNVYPEIQPKSK